jgi:hypothetical protein
MTLSEGRNRIRSTSKTPEVGNGDRRSRSKEYEWVTNNGLPNGDVGFFCGATPLPNSLPVIFQNDQSH